MKVRSDFVSNSSSCSFVVAIPKDYSLDRFIEDVVNDTIASRSDESDDIVDMVKKSNKRNLDYHLNSTELLFLGSLRIDDKVRIFKNEENEDGYSSYKEMADYINDPWLNQHPEEKDFIVEKCNDMEMTVRFMQFDSNITVSTDAVEYQIGRYPFKDEYSNSDRINIAKTIYKYVSLLNNEDMHSYLCYNNSRLFKVTKNTILNTRDLIFAGYTVKLSKWEDLDKLEARIDNGEKLFGIELANGGDGMSNIKIYGLGGWDAKIGNNHAIEFLCYEGG